MRSRVTSFIGRESELAALRFLIGAHRLVTVTGIGGAGKTRLVGELARSRAPDDRTDAVTEDIALVPLSGSATPDLAAETVVRALGGQRSSITDPVAHLAAMVGERRVLLVLDNCEHLARNPASEDGGGAFAQLVEQVLDACPGLQVLATSRLPLRAEGETVWQLPPLQAEAAQELFIERARLVVPGWKPGRAERRAVAGVCDILAGVPLAIEVTAAHAHVVTVAQMADTLAHRLVDLPARRAASPRQQSMRASLEWSHQLLPEDQKVLLRRLAVFAGGWRLADAEAVVPDEALPADRVLSALTGLVDAALVRVVEADGAMRYTLLEPVRQDAAKRLEAAGEASDLRDRHLRRFFALGDEFGPQCRLEAAAARRLRQETENIRAAIEHALDVWPEYALRLVAALSEFWAAAVGTTDPERFTRLALAAAPPHDPLRGRVLAVRSHIAFFRNDLALAVSSGQDAVRFGEDTGDHAALAHALTMLALMAGMADTREGLRLLERAEHLADGVADSPQLALDAGYVRMILTGIEERPAPMREAAQRQSERLSPYRDTWWHPWFYYHRSWISFLDGDETAYAADIETALAAYEAAPAVGVDAFSLGDEAFNLARTGQREQAADRIALAREAALRSGSTLALGRLNAAIALAALHDGRPGQARAAILRSMPPTDGPRLAPALGTVLWLCSTAALADGDVARARGEAEQLAQVAADQLGDNPRFGASAQLLLAKCDYHDGDPSSASYRLRQALATATAEGLAPQVEDALEWLGVAAMALGQPERGLRLVAAGGAAREYSGRVRMPTDRAVIDAAIQTARSALPPNEADAATTEGATSTPEEATEYALRGVGARARAHVGWSSLTPAEQRVARLIAEGLTNAQIAQRLFISAHTVKVHLAHIYAKLGISGRARLAALAAEPAPDRGSG